MIRCLLIKNLRILRCGGNPDYWVALGFCKFKKEIFYNLRALSMFKQLTL